MIRLVNSIAPRSLSGALLRGVAFLVLVNLMDVLTPWAVGSGHVNPMMDVVDTTVIALPFVTLAMLLLHQRRLQEQLTVLATTDMLTGLPNRRAFLARAREAVEDGREGALLILDADHFKRINDAFGHAVGDDCLKAIGEHLRAALRSGDIVGRVGGEEFSIFLPGATRERAAAMGERLCRDIAIEAAGVEAALRVTLSIGVALSEGDAPLDQTMARADQALYRAKAHGRAQIVVWPDGEEEAGAGAPGHRAGVTAQAPGLGGVGESQSAEELPDRTGFERSIEMVRLGRSSSAD